MGDTSSDGIRGDKRPFGNEGNMPCLYSEITRVAC